MSATKICLLLLLGTFALCQALGPINAPIRVIRPIRVHPLPIGPIGRIIPIRRRTTTTPYPTPSMIDIQTWNFTKPSDFARNCLKNQMGKNIVDYCQQKALSDWDPVKMNTSTSTTWEMCCSLYDVSWAILIDLIKNE